MRQRTQILLVGLALVGLWIWRKRAYGSLPLVSPGFLGETSGDFGLTIKPERGAPKQPDLNYSPLPKPDGVLSRDVASVGLPSFDSGAIASVARLPSPVAHEIPNTQSLTRAVRAFVAPTAQTLVPKPATETYTSSQLIASRGWVR